MKIFVCNRTIDSEATDAVLDELLSIARDSIAVLRETEHSENWKERVEKHFKEADFIVFFVGENTFKSDPMKWEYAKAKALNKQIVGIKLPSEPPREYRRLQLLREWSHETIQTIQS